MIVQVILSLPSELSYYSYFNTLFSCCKKKIVYQNTTSIKQGNPTCIAGSQHFFEIIKRFQFLPQKMRGQVNSVTQRNGYYDHSENLLLSITDDIREDIRERAWKLIQSAKTNNYQVKVRLFEIPSLNYYANDYVDIIDVNSDNIFVPPLLNEVKINENIWKKRLSEHGFAAKIVQLPFHTQSVERNVKIVSETSKRVCGKISRNGKILTILQGRSNMKKFKLRYGAAKKMHIKI